MRTLSCVFAVFLVLIMTVTAGLAGEPDGKAVAEIKALIEKHSEAFGAKDMEAVMAMYAQDAILIGTTPMQRWVGAKAIKKAHTEFFKSFDKEVIHVTWTKIRTEGDTAWFAANCSVESAYRGWRDEYPINWSAVLTKKNGKWLFRLAHFSSETFTEEYGGGPYEESAYEDAPSQ